MRLLCGGSAGNPNRPILRRIWPSSVGSDTGVERENCQHNDVSAAASANGFSNPNTNTMLDIGSAPNPTPADLRAIGDAKFAVAHATEPRFVATQTQTIVMLEYFQAMSTAQLESGSHGETLAYILAVDQDNA
jgi:hypothetical protein